MNSPVELLYTKSHEWVKDLGNGIFEVGLTDHAQKELGDLVFVNLPEVDDELVKEESFADVESVKAVSDVFSPLTGVVCEINEEVMDTPAKINESAYEAWLVRVKDVTDKEELISASDYDKFLEQEEA